MLLCDDALCANYHTCTEQASPYLLGGLIIVKPEHVCCPVVVPRLIKVFTLRTASTFDCSRCSAWQHIVHRNKLSESNATLPPTNIDKSSCAVKWPNRWSIVSLPKPPNKSWGIDGDSHLCLISSCGSQRFSADGRNDFVALLLLIRKER